MTELNETAPPPAGFGSTRPGRSGFGTGLERHHPPLIVRGTTVSHLSKTIEAEIIPRLVMAHGNGVEHINEPAVRTRDSDAAAFAELILGPENHRAAEQIQTYRDRGIALETIYLKLFVPAASHLRHLWINDDRDFADITLGLWRLQQLLRDFSPAFCAEAPIRSVGLRALLTPAPGEKHDVSHMMFGLVLAGEFFRRDGWDTWIEPDPAGAAFLQTIRSQWFDIVEFFANGDKKLDELASNIRAVRRASPNPDLGVMVCGPAFTERPELVLLVGGDAVVSDFNQEALQARNVVNLLTDRR
jgi:MerR family transcriptional regulator, light-induced transcriptional regulator